MKLLLLPSFLFTTIIGSAQNTIDITKQNVDAAYYFNVINGTPVVSTKFAKVVEGTPYFKNDWAKGVVILTGGKQYPNMFLKLNILDNQVHYQDEKGKEMVATAPIKKVILTDPDKSEMDTFINSRYIVGLNSPIDRWYQLLAEGKASVLKLINKQMTENKPYGSATIEQKIYSSPQYFILYNNELIKAKKIKELAEIFPEKRKELLKYISDNHLSGKSDNDFIIAVNYYNSLK